MIRHTLPQQFQVMAAPEPPPPPPPPPEPLAQSTGGSQWLPDLGVDENQAKTPKYYFSASISDELQFRGVMGTRAHQHTAGTVVLPVFNVAHNDIDAGRPGSYDAAFLFGPTFDHLGWPVHVQRAHVPADFVGVRRWKQQDPTHLVAVSDSEDAIAKPIYLQNSTFVALQDRAPEPIRPGTVGGGDLNIVDTRAIARLTCFPSGERPRLVGTAAVGGGFDGSQSGAVPSAVVDEVVFGNAQIPLHTPNVDAESMAGASFVLSTDLPEAGNSVRVYSGLMRIAGGDHGENYEFLSETPDDAGLLRIGSEIVCYDQRDPTTGQINLATSGRGLLGTRAQSHQIMEPVTFLENRIVSFLASGLGPTDASIQLANVQDFPTEGTVIIGTELIHYTRIHENALEMPRASSQPGRMDHKGDGLFRGRFGTTPAAHAQGDPVILFPFRYWDRWQSRADAPELAYFTLSLDQPAAYWDACYFDKEDAEACQIGVLARVEPDAPWDADPDADPRLRLYWKGDADGKPIPIGRQSDRIDWRVFVKYAPGAFDATTGLAHGWTQTPTLKKFGAFYFGPGMVYSSVER